MNRHRVTIPPGGEVQLTPDLAVKHQARAVVSLDLMVDEARRFKAATSEAPYLISSAAAGFDLLYRGIAGGWLDESDTVSLLELFGRALKAAENEEGKALFSLDMKLRAALALVEGAAEPGPPTSAGRG